MELVLTNLLLIVLGGCLGSFASLLIYRLPLEDNKINILKPRSFCPQCNTQLSIIQLIPFLGYLYKRGRCLTCNANINRLYLINELIIAAFILFIFNKLALANLSSWLIVLIVFGLYIQAIIDLQTLHLFQPISIILIVSGLMLNVSIGFFTVPLDSFLGLVFGIIIGVPLGLFMGLNRFAKGFFDPLIELYRPVPPLAWAPLIISVLGIDNTGKVFLLFMVSLSIMIISARAGASGTQLSKIHAAHSLGASKKQILRYVIFPNSLPEILTGIRVAVGMCWGTLVAAEFLAGTTGIGFVENVAKKYFQYEVIWITIFIMGMLGLLFDVTLRKIIDKTIPWRGKG